MLAIDNRYQMFKIPTNKGYYCYPWFYEDVDIISLSLTLLDLYDLLIDWLKSIVIYFMHIHDDNKLNKIEKLYRNTSFKKPLCEIIYKSSDVFLEIQIVKLSSTIKNNHHDL